MLARDTRPHLAQAKEQAPAQVQSFLQANFWPWRIACLMLALILARQVLWIFYYSPILGDHNALDRWFAARRCLVPDWCGPRSLPILVPR